jgi:hypothetical protein
LSTVFSQIKSHVNTDRLGVDSVSGVKGSNKGPITEGPSRFSVPTISGAFLFAALAGCAATAGNINSTGSDAAAETSVDVPIADAAMCRFRMAVSDAGVTDSGVRYGGTTDGGDSGTPRGATYSSSSLIGDHYDRTLGDRRQLSRTDSDTAYSLANSETSDNANPFADGMGGSIGPSEVFLHRIGSEFAPFASVVINDSSAGRNYVEGQNFWVRGNTHYDETALAVVGRVNFAAYSMKFTGSENAAGIQACTAAMNGNYAACLGNHDLYNYSTASHRVTVQFLGSDWLITQMTPPNVEVINPNPVVAGGSIKLAKEIVTGIMGTRFYTDMGGRTHENPSYDYWDLAPGYHLYVETQETHSGINRAVFVVVNDDCEILIRDRINEGATLRFSVGGREYLLHNWKDAPGYIMGASWAELSLFSDEITLQDGQQLDIDSDRFRNYRVALGWKNLIPTGGETDAHVDSLRSVIVYSDSVANIASGATDNLRPGEYIPFVPGLGGYRFSYDGLTGRADIPLQLDLSNRDLTISEANGPAIGAGGSRVSCTIRAPYLRGSTTSDIFNIPTGYPVPMSPVSVHSNEFVVGLNGVTCEGTPITSRNAVFVRGSSSTAYSIQVMDNSGTNSSDILFDFGTATPGPASVLQITPRSLDGSMNNGAIPGFIHSYNLDRCTSPSCPEYYVNFSDFTTRDVTPVGSATFFGIRGVASNNATFLFDSYSGISQTTSSTPGALYFHSVPQNPYPFDRTLSGPVTQGVELVGEGYVTEAGNVLDSVSATRVRLNLARELRYGQYTISTSP